MAGLGLYIRCLVSRSQSLGSDFTQEEMEATGSGCLLPTPVLDTMLLNGKQLAESWAHPVGGAVRGNSPLPFFPPLLHS